MRWEPGAERYLEEVISLFEEQGLNHAVWLWESSINLGYDQFDYKKGLDPKSHADRPGNPLLKVLARAWSRNGLRPSSLKGGTWSLP